MAKATSHYKGYGPFTKQQLLGKACTEKHASNSLSTNPQRALYGLFYRQARLARQPCPTPCQEGGAQQPPQQAGSPAHPILQGNWPFPTALVG